MSREVTVKQWQIDPRRGGGGFIYTAVREDAITLYGMKDRATFELFELLLTVSGIGAKSALAIVSKISNEEFALAVAAQDIKTLTRLPGVGKKSAERILLELKDKVKSTSTPPRSAQIQSDSQDEAAEALEALGYTASEIANVFKAAPPNATVEQLVKFALKELNRLGGNNMFEVCWTALRPEREIDDIRQKLAAEFHNDFGTKWREDEINYHVVDDSHFDASGVYDPIIRATFSFGTVCNIDRSDVECFADYYRRLLHRLGVDDVGIAYKPEPETDWTKWRPAVY